MMVNTLYRDIIEIQDVILKVSFIYCKGKFMKGLPKFKDTILKYRSANKTLLRVNGQIATIEDDSGIIWALINKIDGTLKYEEIIDKVVNDFPEANEEDLKEYIQQFDSFHFLENASLSYEGILNDYERDRWSRNIEFFGSISAYNENKFEFQKQLGTAKICLLGCGGLGTHILLDLAAVGFGNITIVDFDTIELSNLNRQVLYKEEDIGKKKVHQAKKRVLDFNSTANVTAIEARLDSKEKIESIIKGHDIVICVADKPRNHLIDWLNAACVGLDIPYINGGLDIRRAVFYSVIPKKTGCTECWRESVNKTDVTAASVIDLHKELDIDYAIPAPAMVTLVAVTAGCMVSEALKIVTNVQEAELTNKLKEFKFDDISIDICEEWEKHNDCKICGNG